MTVTIYEGDCRDVLPTLDAESVQCVVTSPPYWGLRDYGLGDDALGLEPTPELYTQHLVEIFREVRRVLRDDGIMFVNLGDSFADKQLQGIPWRVAFALQADGWWLRSDIIWAKGVSFLDDYAGSTMPESVTDRPTKAHEYLFLLSKSARYFYDIEAVKEASVYPDDDRKARSNTNQKRMPTNAIAGIRPGSQTYPKRNLRSVWAINPAGFKESHFATFPPALVEPCIKAGTSERGCCPECGAAWERVVEKSTTFESNAGKAATKSGEWNLSDTNHPRTDVGTERRDIRYGPTIHTKTTGWRPGCECKRRDMPDWDIEDDWLDDKPADPVPCTVLDLFAGAGTVGLVADRLNRDAILIELNPEYAEMSRKRIKVDAPLFTNVDYVKEGE